MEVRSLDFSAARGGCEAADTGGFGQIDVGVDSTFAHNSTDTCGIYKSTEVKNITVVNLNAGYADVADKAIVGVTRQNGISGALECYAGNTEVADPGFGIAPGSAENLEHGLGGESEVTDGAVVAVEATVENACNAV